MSVNRKNGRVSQRNSSYLRNSINDEMKAVEKMKSSQKYLRKNLLLPISGNVKLMADTCFLTKYEVNIILKSFLSMWSSEYDDTYVQLEKILSKYSSEYGGYVYYEDYFLFVCIFTFFDVSHILNMLLTMCKVYSNLYITMPQIKYFMQSLQLNETTYFDLEFSLSRTMMDIPGNIPSYSIKSFLEYFQKSIAFQTFLYQVKLITINFVFTSYHYKNIMNRIKFYYNNNYNQQDQIILPKESCCFKLGRILLTSEPSPYQYDFSIDKPSSSSFDNMINKIRHQCGYSSRANSIHGLMQMKSSNVHVPLKILNTSLSIQSPQINVVNLKDSMRNRAKSTHNFINDNNNNNNNKAIQYSSPNKKNSINTSINNNINNKCNSNSNTRHMSIPQIEYMDGNSSKKSALAGVVRIKLSDIPNVSLSQSPSP